MGYFFNEEARDELIREIPAMAALKYTNPEIRKDSILCPNPNHADQHYGNCKITRDGRVHCFACGRSFTAYQMLRWDGYSFYETLCILAEESGHPQDYEVMLYHNT